MTLISIIVPTYNVSKYIRQCLDSIANQTFADIEIICVDDGSTDETLQILQEYAKDDSRVQVIKKANTGYGNSVNVGIEASKGQYISIVESDDFICLEMCNILYALTNNGYVDIVKANFWEYFSEDTERLVENKATINTDRKLIQENTNPFTVRDKPEILWGHPSIWSGIYKKDFLDKNNITFMEVKGGGWVDNPFFFETMLLAESIVWTNKPVYYYRKTNLNSSSNNITDLTLPIRRMINNMDVVERLGYKDVAIMKFVYARAMMYIDGVLEDPNYAMQKIAIKSASMELAKRISKPVIDDFFHIWDKMKYYRTSSPLTNIVKRPYKIMLYNWVPFDSHAGGGVTKYCYNIISEMLAKRSDLEIYFLSSGWAYTASTKKCYINRLSVPYSDRLFHFEIVNSPIPAEQAMVLANPNETIQNSQLKDIFRNFIEKNGEFDVIHFQNVEGLSLDVLDLKKEYQSTKFIYSIHNYIPICPTGFYYNKGKHCVCSPEHCAKDCVKCINLAKRIDVAGKLYDRALSGKKEGRIIKKQEWLSAFNFDVYDKAVTIDSCNKFTEAFISKLNSNMDKMFAVSQKVRKIVIQNGIDSEKVMTNYIGTRVADYQINCANTKINANDKLFKLAYLGSDINNEEKGYPFLIDVLRSLDQTIACKVDLVLTTTNGIKKELKNMLGHFNSVEVIKGYKHNQLGEILKGVHLGVVPVLWEDNLPQIAIEMMAHGVPILTSTFGGASELVNNKSFHFTGGDKVDFTNKLVHFVTNSAEVSKFWDDRVRLVTLNEHTDFLFEQYGMPKEAKTITITSDEYITLLQENEFLYKNLSHFAVLSRNASLASKCRKCLSLFKKTIHYCKRNGINSALRRIKQGLNSEL